MTEKVLLDSVTATVEGVASQLDDVERVQDRDGVGLLFGGGGLEASEPVHRYHLHAVEPRVWTGGAPGLERLLGAAVGYVEQARQSGAVTDRGQVDSDGDVLLPAPSLGAPPVR